MNDAWRLVFDEDPFQYVLTRRLRERLVLFEALDSLKADPYQEGDFEIADRSGRTIICAARAPRCAT